MDSVKNPFLTLKKSSRNRMKRESENTWLQMSRGPARSYDYGAPILQEPSSFLSTGTPPPCMKDLRLIFSTVSMTVSLKPKIWMETSLKNQSTSATPPTRPFLLPSECGWSGSATCRLSIFIKWACVCMSQEQRSSLFPWETLWLIRMWLSESWQPFLIQTKIWNFIQKNPPSLSGPPWIPPSRSKFSLLKVPEP